jgi:hypothetical protein
MALVGAFALLAALMPAGAANAAPEQVFFNVCRTTTTGEITGVTTLPIQALEGTTISNQKYNARRNAKDVCTIQFTRP